MTDTNETWEPALETVLTPDPLESALTGGAPHFESARLLRWSLWLAAAIVAISGASLYAGWWFHRDTGKNTPFPIRPDVTAALAELSARIAAIPEAPPASLDDDTQQQASSAAGAPPSKAASGDHRADAGRQASARGNEHAGERPVVHKLTFWAKVRRFFHRPEEKRERTRRYQEVYQKP